MQLCIFKYCGLWGIYILCTGTILGIILNVCVDQVNQDFEEESAEQRSSVSVDIFLSTLLHLYYCLYLYKLFFLFVLGLFLLLKVVDFTPFNFQVHLLHYVKSKNRLPLPQKAPVDGSVSPSKPDL